jgi:hypothetical protein
MTIPITVGSTPVLIAEHNSSRYSIRFQNVGETDIYIKKYEKCHCECECRCNPLVSSTDYEILLTDDDKVVICKATDAFYAVSTSCEAANLAIYEEVTED